MSLDSPPLVAFDLDQTLMPAGREREFKQMLALAAELGIENANAFAEEAWVEANRLFEETCPGYARCKTANGAFGISAHELLWGDPLSEAVAGEFRASHKAEDKRFFEDLQLWAETFRPLVWQKALEVVGADTNKVDVCVERFAAMQKAPDAFTLFEGVPTLLEDLRKFGARLVLVTNGAPAIQLEKIDHALPHPSDSVAPGWAFADAFDHLVISGLHGSGKPFRSIFHVAHSGSGYDAPVMVGDNFRCDIEGAQGAAWSYQGRTVRWQTVWLSHGQQIPDGSQVKPTRTVYDFAGVRPALADLLGNKDLRTASDWMNRVGMGMAIDLLPFVVV